jgi:SAM-dependent methyltransferase
VEEILYKEKNLKKWNRYISRKLEVDIKNRGITDIVANWNCKAESFDMKKFDTPDEISYVEKIFKFIKERIPFDKNSSILDVGAGTGILSLPLAKNSYNVTALEPSTNMLDILLSKGREYNVGENLNIINKRWRDTDCDTDFFKHDITIAHRCMGMISLDSSMRADFNNALTRLNDSSRKGVFIFFPGVSEINEHISSFIPEFKRKGESYSYFDSYGDGVYNLAFLMEYSPRVEYIFVQNDEIWPDVNSLALSRIKKLGLSSESEKEILYDFLNNNIDHDYTGKRIIFTNRKKIKVIWWDKK